jgi:hypothetical protein
MLDYGRAVCLGGDGFDLAGSEPRQRFGVLVEQCIRSREGQPVEPVESCGEHRAVRAVVPEFPTVSGPERKEDGTALKQVQPTDGAWQRAHAGRHSDESWLGHGEAQLAAAAVENPEQATQVGESA